MDFTELYKQSASLVSFSPGAQFILSAAQDRIIVRRTDTFQIARTWLLDSSTTPTQDLLSSKSTNKQTTSTANSGNPSDAWITHVGWSCDSEYILAACAKQGVVHLLKLRDEEWNGRIDSGAEGLAKAEWAPDGRTVLCFSNWGLRVSLWSILTGSATYIQFPVHPDKGYAFRSDGRYFVLAERHKSKDTLGIYDATAAYRLVRHFPLPTTSLSSLALSPTGNHVATWEGPLEYKLHVLTLTGELLTSFTPYPDPGFGIRNVAWHPSGMFLAVGGWDDKVHFLDSLSWSSVSTLELVTRLSSNTRIWREPAQWIEGTQGRGFISYDRIHGSHVLNAVRPDVTKAHPKTGVVQLSWNLTGSLLLARFGQVLHVFVTRALNQLSDNLPSAVYVFEFPAPKETFSPRLRSVLIHSQPVVCAKWNPVRKGNFALCCGTQSVYTWSDEWLGELGEEEEMAECIGVPAKGFETRDLRWAPDGKGFLLLGKEQFCGAFEVQEEELGCASKGADSEDT